MKKSIFLLTALILLLILVIPSVNALYLNTLTGVTSKTESFIGNQSVTEYLYIPTNAHAISSTLTVVGSADASREFNADAKAPNPINVSVSNVGVDGEAVDPYGSRLYVLEYDNSPYWAKVSTYYLNGTFISRWNANSSSCNSAGNYNGLGTDGTNIWISEATNNIVCKYTLAGTYVSQWALQADCSNPHGIAVAGTYVWVLDRDSTHQPTFFKHQKSNGAFVSSYTGTVSGWGLSADTNYLWGLASPNSYLAYIYKYDASTFALVNTFNVSASIYGDGYGYRLGLGYDMSKRQYMIYEDGQDEKVRVLMGYALYPTTPYLEIGLTDGDREWSNSSTSYKSSTAVTNFDDEVNSALANGACSCTGCSIVGSDCKIPFIFNSNDYGNLTWQSFNMNYYTMTVTPNSYTTAIAPLATTNFNISFSLNGNTSVIYNLIDSINTTAINITHPASVTLDGTLLGSDTESATVNIESLLSYNTTYIGYINVTRQSDSVVIKQIPLSITINTAVGNIVFVDNTSWSVSMKPSETKNQTWVVNNTGTGTLTNCTPSFSSDLNGQAFVTFNPASAFNLTVGETKNITVTLTTPPEGTYSDKLNIICNTGTGYDSVDYALRPLLSVTVTEEGGGGGGGGGGGVTEITYENVTLVQFATKPPNIDVYLLYSPFGETPQKFVQTVTSSRFIKKCSINAPFTCEVEPNKISVDVIYYGNSTEMFTEVVNGTLQLTSDQDERTDVSVTFRLIGYRLLIIILVLAIMVFALLFVQPKTKKTIL